MEYVGISGLEATEERWIIELKANVRSYGYNARVHVTNNRGLVHSDTTRKKISKNRKGKGRHKYYMTEETRKLKRELIKAQNLKQYRTEDTEKKRLENLRKIILGKPITDEHKDRISLKNTGSNNGMAKLTELEVKEIKKLLKKTNLSQDKIAASFNVSRRTIGMIKNGSRWGHIQVE